jgi:hypothetical protein
MRDNKPLKYAQISLCVMDLPQGSDLYQEKYRTVKPPRGKPLTKHIKTAHKKNLEVKLQFQSYTWKEKGDDCLRRRFST